MLPRPTPVISIQAEVLANLRSQAIGGHTVADLGLPDAFLRRVADRITRDSFQEHFRTVMNDGSGVPEPNHPPADGLALQEGAAERRSFRAPNPGETTGPTALSDLPPVERGIANVAMRGLAPDGILLAVAKAIRSIGPAEVAAAPAASLERLDRLGLPTDLLEWFSIGEARGGVGIVSWLATQATPTDKLRSRLAAAEFRPTPTIAGFRACADSGQTSLDRVRVQVPFARYWLGPGDGSALDLIRSLCELAPETELIAVTPASQAAGLREEFSRWSPPPRATIVPVDAPVSQWARDNAREGTTAAGLASVLTPRYATRGEPGSVAVPGESAATAALRVCYARVFRSPLLFQGGNLIVVEEPGRRTLLAGEAEVWRNVSLGLSETQARDSLRVEMGCDRIAVLPAASFHIDAEVSVRTTPDGVICFVADPVAGARIVLRSALRVIGAGDAAASLRDGGDHRPAMDVLGRWLAAQRTGAGAFPAAAASQFSTGAMDPGPSNLHRILHALDILTAHDLSGSMLPDDRNARAYLEAIHRQATDRRILRRTLQDLGWRVLLVPCLPDSSRGICPLNALHTPDSMIVPWHGGVLEPVDAAAISVLSSALPGVRVMKVRSAESQRRSGAVRCAVATTGPSFML